MSELNMIGGVGFDRDLNAKLIRVEQDKKGNSIYTVEFTDRDGKKTVLNYGEQKDLHRHPVVYNNTSDSNSDLVVLDFNGAYIKSDRNLLVGENTNCIFNIKNGKQNSIKYGAGETTKLFDTLNNEVVYDDKDDVGFMQRVKTFFKK